MRMRLKSVILALIFSISAAHANRPIIVWDIHDVLLQPYDQFVTLLKFPHLRNIFSHISWPLIKHTGSLLLQHFSREVSSEEYIHMAIENGNPHLAELIVSIANAQRPITGMRSIVQELHNLGIEQHIGSNIGKTSFYRLLDKQKYPQIAALLKYMNLEKSVVSKFIDGSVIKKPDVRFFERYLTKNSIDFKKQHVIFIDDRWDNVRVARAMGFDGILFKNPNQLRNELHKRAIPIRIPSSRYTNQRDRHSLRDTSRFYRSINSIV
ncbi:MAG: HAD family hydrolase [uncultured bacterium]|nr:MAG: HAD family hydrolase [uncultured bacterium]HLE76647.1 hypothetical protein [Candidatus Babeliales bacterium]